MTSATPTTVMVKNDTKDLAYGTGRRLVTIYVEASPAVSATTDLSTYVPNLSTVALIRASGTSTGNTAIIASMPSWSTTTVTWNQKGAQFAEFVGYYT